MSGARVLALATPAAALSFAPIPESPADADADAEFGTASSFSAAPTADTASSSSAAVDDADFYSMDSCLHDILNDDAWKDDGEEETEGDDTVALPFAALASAVSSLPPCTPGRLGTGAARVLTSTTPRRAGGDRGSIYGGAIRTPLRTKPPTPAVKTVPARLTISGALPSATTHRAAATTTAAAPTGPLSSPAPAAGFALSAAQRVKPAAVSSAAAAPMATPVKPGAVIFRIAPSPAAPIFAPSASWPMLPPKTPARK